MNSSDAGGKETRQRNTTRTSLLTEHSGTSGGAIRELNRKTSAHDVCLSILIIASKAFYLELPVENETTVVPEDDDETTVVPTLPVILVRLVPPLMAPARPGPS